jgi:hypothetical protein
MNKSNGSKKHVLFAVITTALCIRPMMADEIRIADNGEVPTAVPVINTPVAEKPVTVVAPINNTGLPKSADSARNNAVTASGSPSGVPPVGVDATATQVNPPGLLVTTPVQGENTQGSRSIGIVRSSARLGSKIGSKAGRVLGGAAGGTVGVVIKLGSLATTGVISAVPRLPL